LTFLLTFSPKFFVIKKEQKSTVVIVQIKLNYKPKLVPNIQQSKLGVYDLTWIIKVEGAFLSDHSPTLKEFSGLFS
jgi:hypothetical protein